MIRYEGQEKACNFTLRMSRAMRNKIQELADREDITPTYFIRNSIERTLKEDEQKQERKLTSA